VIKVCRQCQHGFWATDRAPQRYCTECKADRAKSREADFAKKNRARGRVSYAVFNGHITRQPCEVCAAPQAQAHHVDYDQPLNVRWLCPVHHAAEHRNGA
jgi:hypothetical protein